MTAIPRSLGYSLIIHFILLAVLLFSLPRDQKSVSRIPLKIHRVSLLSTPSVFSKPTIAPPKIPTEHVKPIQKITPLKPVLPTETSFIPTVASIKQTAQTTSPVPLQSTPIETPKILHTVKALPSTPNINIEKEFLDAHLGEIRALLIQNLKYPRNAQRLKMQGEVRVSFRLKSDGSVENIEVTQSSGFEILDEDACALIKNTAPKFPKPSKEISLSVPLSYVLR